MTILLSVVLALVAYYERARITAAKYRFEHWFFQWTLDEDDAITLTVAGVLNLTKYKEHTIVRVGRGYKRAPKHVYTYLSDTWPDNRKCGDCGNWAIPQRATVDYNRDQSQA